MKALNKTKVQCLCGAVTISARLRDNGIQACHCMQCQIWTGGGPLYVVPIEDPEIEGEEHIARYHASEHGERAFCSKCGTNLYWTMRDEPPFSLPVGLLADQSDLDVKDEIFVDFRPQWLPVFDDAKQSSEQEELALLEKYLKDKNTQN